MSKLPSYRLALPEGAPPLYERDDETDAPGGGLTFRFVAEFEPLPEGVPPHFACMDEIDAPGAGVTFKIIVRGSCDAATVLEQAIPSANQAAVNAWQKIDGAFLDELEDALGQTIPLLTLRKIRSALAHYYFQVLHDEVRTADRKKRRQSQLKTLHKLQGIVPLVARDLGPQASVEFAQLIEKHRKGPRRFHHLDQLITDLAAAREPMIGRRTYSPEGPFAKVLRYVWHILPNGHRSKSEDAFAARAAKIRSRFGARSRKRLLSQPPNV